VTCIQRKMAARTTTILSFAICFILGVDCSSRGAVASGASSGGCVDNGGTCDVVLKLSDRRQPRRELRNLFASLGASDASEDAACFA
jgi:hypothetical protein